MRNAVSEAGQGISGLGEELGVLGCGNVFPPRENAGGLRGLQRQPLLVQSLLARHEYPPIRPHACAVFDETSGCPLPVEKHLRSKIQLEERAYSGQRGFGRENQIFVTDFQVGLCADSERCRSAFRTDVDHDSEVMPITVPN